MNIYALNNKILTLNNAWLKEADSPAVFVMNASNATLGPFSAGWESPTYPNAYDGDGKHVQIIIKESGCTFTNLTLYYATGITNTYGSEAISAWPNPSGSGYIDAPVGTYDITLQSNTYMRILRYIFSVNNAKSARIYVRFKLVI